MKKKIPLILLFTILAFLLFAQQKKGKALIDSLENEIQKYDAKSIALNKAKFDKSDTAKIKLLTYLVAALSKDGSYEKAEANANLILEMSKKIDFKKGISEANDNIGFINYYKGNYKEALVYYDAALKVREEINDKKGQATCYDHIAIVHAVQGNYQEALKNARNAIKIHQEIGNKEGLAAALNNIGAFYVNQSNYPDALNAFNTSLKLAKETNNKRVLADAYANIGYINEIKGNSNEALKNYILGLKLKEAIGDKRSIAIFAMYVAGIYELQGDFQAAHQKYLSILKIREDIGDKSGIADTYNNIGSVFEKQNNLPAAFDNFSKALKIQKEIGNKHGITTTHNRIGNTYQKQKNYNEALKNYNAALNIEKETGDKRGVVTSYINIGSLNIQLKKYDIAKKYLDSAIVLGNQIGLKEEIVEIYRLSSNVDSVMGNWKDAFLYHELYIKNRDSLVNQENTKKTTQTILQYEFDKKQDSIKLENQKRELALQKEIDLKALEFEYAKKQATAKSDKERQQLKYEQQLKEQQIEAEYAQKEAVLVAEQKRKEAVNKIEQEKKDAIAQSEIKRQESFRNFSLMGLMTVLLFLGIVVRQHSKVKIEKQRSDDLLLNILPNEVAEELKANGSAAAKQYNNVSVLFTDFVGFTQLSETLTPTELVAEIHKNFTAFDKIIEKYGLEKIKTVGDAYIAVCGLPNEDKNHAKKTVQAALEIRKYIQDSDSKFDIRIGINSGSLVAGIVGVKKFAYDIWGDTVNIAARMEQNSEVGKVNISSSTYNLVNEHFICFHRGKIQAKNKGEIDMYFVH